VSYRLLVRRAAARLGVLPAVFAAYRSMQDLAPARLLANRSARRAARGSGVPIPPGRLRYLSTTTRELRPFLEGADAAASALRAALVRAGSPLESMTDVLDFGCGCGRLLRQWGRSAGVKLYGCDYNPAGIAWIAENLPWVSASVNSLRPPLPYGDEAFDFVYAMSVFTHLPVDLQAAWMAEMRRVIRPGGLLAITTMGEAFAHSLSEDERSVFESGDIVVREASLAGTNLCAVYHPEQYLRGNPWPGFEVVDFHPNVAPPYVVQDQYLLRRRS
jgi:SAM-dependent methyltransferase